jgi:hypothetical protein
MCSNYGDYYVYRVINTQVAFFSSFPKMYLKIQNGIIFLCSTHLLHF